MSQRGRAVPCHSHTPHRPGQGRCLVSRSLCVTPQPGPGHAALVSGGEETGGGTKQGQRPRNGQTQAEASGAEWTGWGGSWASPLRSEAQSALPLAAGQGTIGS